VWGALKAIADKNFSLGPVIKTDLCIEEKIILRSYFGHNSSSFEPSLTITSGDVDEVITQ